MEQLLSLIPEEKKSAGEEIISKWQEETGKLKRPRIEKGNKQEEDIRRKIEEYTRAKVAVPNLQIEIEEDDFSNMYKCA